MGTNKNNDTCWFPSQANVSWRSRFMETLRRVTSMWWPTQWKVIEFELQVTLQDGKSEDEPMKTIGLFVGIAYDIWKPIIQDGYCSTIYTPSTKTPLIPKWTTGRWVNVWKISWMILNDCKLQPSIQSDHIWIIAGINYFTHDFHPDLGFATLRCLAKVPKIVSQMVV